MKNDLQAPKTPPSLALLRAIATELRERCTRILFLEVAVEADLVDENRRRLLVAELATHRLELRRTRGEMERSGYSIVYLDPSMVRVRESSDVSGRVIELGSAIPSKDPSRHPGLVGARADAALPGE